MGMLRLTFPTLVKLTVVPNKLQKVVGSMVRVEQMSQLGAGQKRLPVIHVCVKLDLRICDS